MNFNPFKAQHQANNNSTFRNCGDFAGRGFGPGKAFAKRLFELKNGQGAKVNIKDTEEAYAIDVYAAGRQKAGFSVSVNDNVLTISYKSDDSATPSTYSYQEEANGSFERRFQLNEKVLSDKITASYDNGVLCVTIPKDPTAATPAQTINVQ